MTKAEKKQLKQLQQKKYRNRTGTFVVEGWKSILSFLESGYIPHKIYSVSTNIPDENIEVEAISAQELKVASALQHPKDAIAIFGIKKNTGLPKSGLILALDNLQDPGNMGTIIRTADWFGIKDLVCSLQTADCYNPKVVQATMGSLANVNIHYTDLKAYLHQTDLPVYGTFLEGENVYKASLPSEAIVVIGNEGKGIRKEIETEVDYKIHIPKHRGTLAESLNAAIATALIVGAFLKN